LCLFNDGAKSFLFFQVTKKEVIGQIKEVTCQ